MHTVLIADDQPNIRTILRTMLERNNYICLEARDGQEALDISESIHPDLIILDVMMPHVDGFDVCTRIRRVDQSIPILLLSAKDDITDKRIGYQLGADDYMTKPFNEEELLLRIGALLRRTTRALHADHSEDPGNLPTDASPGASTILRVGDLTIDLLRHKVAMRDQTISLTPTEFNLLTAFASNPDIVLTKEELIERVWGENYLGGTISIPAHIRHLRSKIEENPSLPTYLETIWGFGYRLNSQKNL